MTWHVASHGSPAVPFNEPSSHSSAHSIRPFPHASFLQVAEQPSHGVVLPSSHSSPGSTMPLPHTATAAHGARVELTTTCAEGWMVAPAVIGGFVGSRYSKRLSPAG